MVKVRLQSTCTVILQFLQKALSSLIIIRGTSNRLRHTLVSATSGLGGSVTPLSGSMVALKLQKINIYHMTPVLGVK